MIIPIDEALPTSSRPPCVLYRLVTNAQAFIHPCVGPPLSADVCNQPMPSRHHVCIDREDIGRVTHLKALIKNFLLLTSISIEFHRLTLEPNFIMLAVSERPGGEVRTLAHS